MSYASVTARDAPPPSEQPHPDPALLTTERSPSSNVIDDTSKVNVISRNFNDDPSKYTSSEYVPEDTEGEFIDTSRTEGKGKASRRLQEAQAEGSYLWEVTKHYFLLPSVAGGLVGLVNIGLLSSVGYAFYTKPDLRRNFTAIGSAAGGALLLIGTEGCAARKYREIRRGHQEERRAHKEETLFYKHFLNTAILGAVGYYSYANWDKPKWNRDVVTAVSLGILTLWGGEGYLAERYRAEWHRQ